MITKLRPMLWTEDLKGTVDFYVEKLGFACRELNEDWGWASLHIDDVWIMLARPNEHEKYDKIGLRVRIISTPMTSTRSGNN